MKKPAEKDELRYETLLKLFFGNENGFEGAKEHIERFEEKCRGELAVLNMFAENNIVVKPAIMYRTVATEWPKDKPFDYDMIVLFTPSGVAALKKNFPNWEQGDTVIAAFGANTVAALETAGFQVVIKAPTSKYASITTAIKDFLDAQNED